MAVFQLWRLFTLLPCFFIAVVSQTSTPPSSYPHDYPGRPNGDYSPVWQRYFEVTTKLPNITFPLGRSFAGNLPVNRAGHPNDTLFFYGFEQSPGSLTPLTDTHKPWTIWLNGGPGSSSMFGLFFENGPIQIGSDYSAKPNPFSFDRLADTFWIDNPVGVGFSTADSDGYVADEDQLGEDFMGFLSNLVKVFPSLETRPLYLTGESYAGQYIPYILKTYFGMKHPPVHIAKVAIGDGTYAAFQVFADVPVISVIETYPQLIAYDQDVYNYFKRQSQLCGYDLNLTYPQNNIIPEPPLIGPTQRSIPPIWTAITSRKGFLHELMRRAKLQPSPLEKRTWKRDGLQTNDTIDPWYGCHLFEMLLDHAVNYTFPWNLTSDYPVDSAFNPYNISDASNPKVNVDASVFLNDPTVRDALHAPQSKDWALNFDFPFGERTYIDPSPVASNFLTALATNATAKGVGIVLYSGNADAIVPHFGTEVAIQNTTFGGIQGFTRRPSTPWYSDAGEFAGVVHQERGWTYNLFYGAGHMVPRDVPDVAYKFYRDFVFGDCELGSVISPKPGVTAVVVVGGEDSKLEGVIRGPDGIVYGSEEPLSTYIYPKATRDAWSTFHTAYQPKST